MTMKRKDILSHNSGRAAKMTHSRQMETSQAQDIVKVRDDGKYECNHPCKDKSKCRHLCCREGRPDAPPSKRKPPGVQQPPAASPINANAPTKITRLHSSSQTLQKKSHRKDDSLEDLNAPRRRSPAGENVSLSRGGRLSLDTSRPVKRKLGSPSHDYDVSFTELGCTGSQNVMDIPEEWDESDEDMPETIIPQAKTKENVNSLEVKEKAQKKASTVHISTPKIRSGPVLFLSDSDDSVEIVEPVRKKAKLQKTECKSSVESDTTSRKPSPNTTNIVSSSTYVAPESTLEQCDAPRSPHDEEFAELDAWLQSGGVNIV
ncbi:hypothetical protein D9619_005500 [Psilocybe cf. subviscida]|uniref:Uncharacterized protein n=1 Tax=Psilocybe cf. subviscida TaxID=2480587 RepID=A0A8H5FC51_9AGAR|nr:hypothetical protein D9619_005500 [Psilocybe cf. subviscida]